MVVAEGRRERRLQAEPGQRGRHVRDAAGARPHAAGPGLGAAHRGGVEPGEDDVEEDGAGEVDVPGRVVRGAQRPSGSTWPCRCRPALPEYVVRIPASVHETLTHCTSGRAAPGADCGRPGRHGDQHIQRLGHPGACRRQRVVPQCTRGSELPVHRSNLTPTARVASPSALTVECGFIVRKFPRRRSAPGGPGRPYRAVLPHVVRNALSSLPASPGPLSPFHGRYLAPYLLPTTVGQARDHLGLPPPQAGLIGSALLLSSAAAGFALACRVGRHRRPRPGPDRACCSPCSATARAAVTTSVPLVVIGRDARRLRSGTATTVAATGIAAQRDPHRASTAGPAQRLRARGRALSDDAAPRRRATASRSPRSPSRPLRRLARDRPPPAAARRRPRRAAAGPAPPPPLGPGPGRRACSCWSLAQNSLWGVSGRIGLDQAGSDGGHRRRGLRRGARHRAAGVLGAGALGSRLGRAVPDRRGHGPDRGCIVVSASRGRPRVASRPARSPGTRSTRWSCRI